jgi:hypothetical protein
MRYLGDYVSRYREEFARFTTAGGYPRLTVSSYLDAKELVCYLARDGAAVADQSPEPPGGWATATDRTFMMGFPTGLPDAVWHGDLPIPSATARTQVGTMLIRVAEYDLDWLDLLGRLTFGWIGLIDLKLPRTDAPFWNPPFLRDIGFASAGHTNRRFFHYLELIRHRDDAAWDPRGIWARVHVDIRRDYSSTIGLGSRKGGTMFIAGPQAQAVIGSFNDRLEALSQAIDGFQGLLEEEAEEDERLFHEFLKANPVLLDASGDVISKPQFVFPAGESPLEKEYVEPDFLIQYSGNAYKLVELERPGKLMATKQGQPRAEVTQAAFQIAEWKDYIAHHYGLLKERYPGISISCSTTLVISRASERSFGSGHDIRRYLVLIKSQLKADEILLYDDLLDRAKQTYVRLSNLEFRQPE